MIPDKPNFILVHTDQQRGDCLGITGRRRGLFTPHLDGMANRGMRFDAAYSTCPVCIPQRMTLMSGQLATTHGVLWNVGIPEWPFQHTLPGELGKGGYQTALVGRTMHLRPESNPYGFEYYVPGDPSSSHKQEDPFFRFFERHAPEGAGGYYANGTANNSVYGAPFHLPERLHHTHWTTERALDFLNERDPSRPFMLAVGYYSPHGPHNPPPFHFNRYYNMDGLDDPAIGEWAIPPVGNWSADSASYVNLTGELLRCCRAGYYGNISFIDAQMGRLLSRVNLSNTYVIFTSDHGEMLGDHYRFHKCTGYEGSARIPFLVMGPGIPCGGLCDAPVGWHDILPTILDLAGIECPKAVDGHSMRPLLENGQAAGWREYLFGECLWGGIHQLPGQRVEGNPAYEGGHHFATNGRWKYLWHPIGGTEQLFNLVDDPNEKLDLAGQPEYLSELELWRSRMVSSLRDRPEGFSDGKKLIPGKPMRNLMPHAQEICDRRIAEGHDILYYYSRKK